MSAGIPVVCTSVAIAGMPFEAGKDFLLSDEPDGLADAIIRVLSDEQLAGSLSRNALEQVRQSYGAEAQERRVLDLVTGMIS
jgi:glycosyltransferase involved in cell wall biosynthesis